MLLQRNVSSANQERAVLAYAAERGLTVSAVSASPTAALQLVKDGIVGIVLVCFTTRGTDELAEVIRDLGGELQAVRQSNRVDCRTVDGRNEKLVRQAIERGATPEMAALVLGVPIGQVLTTLGRRNPGPVPQLGAPDRERRPQPLGSGLFEEEIFPGDVDKVGFYRAPRPAGRRPQERRPRRVR
ncbi:MAG TPA: hypothetical protein VGP91_11855 [Actinoplanes sp.]|jgi:hypothetical protein|nr:hypothetical protein [Actinoplanes sp.]